MKETQQSFRASIVRGENMTVAEMVDTVLRENPDVQLVLEIAARAQERSEMEAARDVYSLTEVSAAIPTSSQCAV
jgi:hypothetical protein